MRKMTELNPFEEELKETLITLDAIDRRLSHEPDALWPSELSKERAWLVWHAFDIARELDWSCGILCNFGSWPVVVIVLPTGKQVSWHVPPGPEFDGHTREEKTKRIEEWVDIKWMRKRLKLEFQ